MQGGQRTKPQECMILTRGGGSLVKVVNATLINSKGQRMTPRTETTKDSA